MGGNIDAIVLFFLVVGLLGCSNILFKPLAVGRDHVRSVLATYMYMYISTWILERLVLVALVLNDSIPAYSPIYCLFYHKEFVNVIPTAKPHFCTCSTFLNICKDGHALTCKPDAIFFVVATNSTYVSVSVRVYIFFHLCRMKTTNTAKNPQRRTL